MNRLINKKHIISSTLAMLLASVSHAATVNSVVNSAEGNPLGQVTFEDSKYGLLVKPQLHGLPVGIHGFHLHQHADCSNGGMGAGGHFDPANTNSHQGPFGEGHLGDLPVLAVDSNGDATIPVLAPRLKTEDLTGLAIMIHAGGDNYSDTPPLGGGGARIGCGKIPS